MKALVMSYSYHPSELVDKENKAPWFFCLFACFFFFFLGGGAAHECGWGLARGAELPCGLQEFSSMYSHLHYTVSKPETI